MCFSHQQEKLTIVIVICFKDRAGIIILNFYLRTIVCRLHMLYLSGNILQSRKISIWKNIDREGEAILTKAI